jgi:hypothetical protein
MWPGKTRPLSLFKQKIKYMANMSYCRFENTLRDLRDCYNNMDNDNLSKSEFSARKQMIEMCINIVNQHDGIIEQEFLEDDFEEDGE